MCGMIGLAFALGSMVFAGLTDFYFKKYVNRTGVPLGSFLAGIGLVWVAFFAVPLVWRGEANWHGWPLALAAGATSIVANILLVKALCSLDAGVGSTVYRLNMVVVLVLGIVLFAEPVNAMKLTAVSLGVVAVLLMYQPAHVAGDTACRQSMLPFILVVIAAGLRAGMALLYKYAMDQGVGREEFLVINGACWLLGGLLLALLHREAPLPSARGWRYALVTGLVICGNVYFLALALTHGQLSIVVPISQLSFTITLLLGWRLLGETLTKYRILALASAVLCILAMARA